MGRSKTITGCPIARCCEPVLDLNFPSDLYVLQGVVDLLGHRQRLHVLHSEDGLTVPTEALREAIDKNTALVTLTHTAFKSGYVYDMAAITAAAQSAGALTLWDLSHSIGALPLALNTTSTPS